MSDKWLTAEVGDVIACEDGSLFWKVTLKYNNNLGIYYRYLTDCILMSGDLYEFSSNVECTGCWSFPYHYKISMSDTKWQCLVRLCRA